MTDQPAHYRRRPAEVEAVQWTDTNADALATFAGHRFMTVDPEDRIDDPDATASLIESEHECWSLLRPGDWVVKRGDDFAVQTPEEFADLYEAQPGDEEAEEREDLLDTYRQMINDAEFAPRGSLVDGAYRFLLGEIDRLRAEAEDAAPSAGRAALRARVAAALREHGMVHLGGQVPADEYDCCADAVLAAAADRGAVLDAVALRSDLYDDLAQLARETGNPGLQHAQIRDHIAEFLSEGLLRRLAAEARQDPTPDSEPEPDAAEVPAPLPFIHVDDDGDQLDIGTVMASTYDGEVPVVYVAADQHQGDQVATVYVRPERVDEVIAALCSARQAIGAMTAVSSGQPDTDGKA